MKDLLTGEEFEPKRSTQKFACSENRIKYNNMRANELRTEKSIIDKPLSNNLNILNKLMMGKNEAIFYNQYLLGKEYDFKVFNCVKEYNGTRGYGIYQYIMLHLENEQTKFIRL